jgi:putative hemolysin
VKPDKPPQRRNSFEALARRVQIAAGAALGLILAGSWLISDHAASGWIAAQPDLQQPATGWIVAVAMLFSVLLNAVYVAAETALTLVKHVHVKHVSEQNPKNGERLHALVEGRSSYVAACSLGLQICRLTLMLLCIWLATNIAPTVAERYGFAATYGAVLATGVALLIPVALVNLVVELVPKSYASLHPHRVAVALRNFIVVSKFILSPLVGLVTGVANVFTARFGVKASFAPANQAEEEIKTLVESAQQTGEIESDEKELLHSVFEFSDTVAREVMTPRVDLDAVPVVTEAAEVMEMIHKSGHSRIPVYEETDDQIVGIVHAKDLLMAMLRGKGRPSLRSLMRPAHFVPENKDLHELLTEMRLSRSQMVVVQDEFGGTAGIVTIEDIVEELVGDIVDEYDVEEPQIVAIGEAWLVDGKTHLDDLSDQVEFRFDSEEFDTVGGYVFGLFGRQPKEGEAIESEGYLFTVAETDGRRIMRLKVEAAPAPSDSQEEETAGAE